MAAACPRWYNAALTHTKWMGNPISPTLSSNCGHRRARFCQTSPGMHAWGILVPIRTVFKRSNRPSWVRTEAKSSQVFPTAMVVKVKDAETKRNKASVAHTGWKKRTKTSTTTPKKVCLYSSSLQLLFQQKICKSVSDRAAGKPHTPCDWASCVKERGLMRSSPTVLQSSLSFLSCFFFPVFSVVSSIL